jgi:CRP/FNR family transcriptional regulator, nitrogen oxide reductase regulator
MTADRTGEAVARIPVFRRLRGEDRLRVAQAAELRSYGRGSSLFSEGDEPNAFFFLVEGRVKIARSTPGGREVILDVFGEGDAVGVVAVFEDFPFPASGIALEPTECLVIPRTRFLDLLANQPTVLRGLLSGFSMRLMELTRRIVELSAGRVEGRIAQLLVRLAHEEGRREDEGLFIPARLTRQELADLCGTTFETTIRVMSRWTKDGLLRTEADGFRLLDFEALERISST